MTCQNCNIRPATLHYTKVINGKKAEVHLCEQCAEQSGYTSFFQSPQSNFSFHDLLAGLLHSEPAMFDYDCGPTGPITYFLGAPR